MSKQQQLTLVIPLTHPSFIVFDDANLDIAVEGVLASKFRAAGQTCVCAVS